jgi:UDP-4-amino-4,6-dideoxy-N-acetyl-beta-L-altrosamine transaminase
MISIPYARQSIVQEDIDAVVEVLKSDWLTQGPTVPLFEEEVAAYCGARHAVAVTNGTSALHIACRALGVGPGDLVWTSTNTFVASANCVLFCGGSIDFVDVEPDTHNLDVVALEKKLVDAERCGRLPKALVAVHFGGQPCDMERIAELARTYGFAVVEDASHALGASYRNDRVGSCRYSDLAILSFHPVKIVTTGEGGMVLCNDAALYERLLLFRSHGITRDPQLMPDPCEGPWFYEQIELGYNYRMTEMQAALGRSQLRRVEEFVARRGEIAARYERELADLPLELPVVRRDRTSAWHLYPIVLNGVAAQRREEVFRALTADGVRVNVHYIPVHTQPYYRRLGFRKGDYPVAESYYARTLSLPMYYELSEREQDHVVAALRAALA